MHVNSMLKNFTRNKNTEFCALVVCKNISVLRRIPVRFESFKEVI
jgi:hypothetical protein